MFPNMPITTYNMFSSLDKDDDHGEPSVIPPSANDHGKSNGISAPNDEVVLKDPTNNSS